MTRILIVARNRDFPSPLPIREGGPWDGRIELHRFSIHPAVEARTDAQDKDERK